MSDLENFTKFSLEILQKKDQTMQNFLKEMKIYEEEYYKSHQNNRSQQLVPELQKKDVKPEAIDHSYFLHQKNTDPEYLQSYNQYNRFNNNLREKEAPHHLNKQFQQQQEIQFNEFTRPNQNFLDVEANTKHFYPDQDPFLKNQNKPTQDYGNAQNMYVNYAKPANFENTGTKVIYPRGLFKPTEQVERPSMLTQDRDLANEIDKLGGIEDTLAGTIKPNPKPNPKSNLQPLQQYEVEAYKEMISSYKYKDLQMHQNFYIQQTQQRPNHDIGKRNIDINNTKYDPLYIGDQQAPPQVSQSSYEPFSKHPVMRMQYHNIQPQQRTK